MGEDTGGFNPPILCFGEIHTVLGAEDAPTGQVGDPILALGGARRRPGFQAGLAHRLGHLAHFLRTAASVLDHPLEEVGAGGLLLLISVSELRNLSAAARVGLSQAGASMALSRMESALGQPLFQRMMQGMVATDAGALIVSRGKRIVAELRHMQSDVAAIAGTMQGRIAIGALPLGRTHVLPTAIAAALQRHPNIRVTTVESPYEALVAGLRDDGDIDFIVGALRAEERNAGLITESLFEDRLGIIARLGHPLAGAPVSLRDLLPQRWILPRPGAPGRRLIDQSFRELAIEPPVPSVETGDLAVLRGLLKNSDMLTAISPHQLHHEIASGDLVELPVALGKTVRQIGITLREGAMLSPAALVVLDEIRSASRRLPGVLSTSRLVDARTV